MEPARAHKLFVGIDVAAASVTVAWVTLSTSVSRPITIEQTATGFAKLHHHLTALGYPPQEILVVMEATGSYWISLATTLVAAGFAVSVINPKQAHDFANALLKRAKTDAVDAQTLAQLAAMLRPTPWTPPPAIYEELQQRLAQRAALIDLRQQVRNQRHALTQKPYVVAAVRERMDTLIATFTAQIGELEAEIATALQQDAAWAAAAARLQTITGIGVLSTAWLLVATLNFTLCPSPEALTAYAGLVPYKRESGSSVRKRPCIGHTGHAQLRTAVYLAALSATQYNPIIKPFYARLRAQGKSKKVARCAAARKLLHIAWAVATKEQPFDPHYQTGGVPEATTP
jgi:transposase